MNWLQSLLNKPKQIMEDYLLSLKTDKGGYSKRLKNTKGKR